MVYGKKKGGREVNFVRREVNYVSDCKHFSLWLMLYDCGHVMSDAIMFADDDISH